MKTSKYIGYIAEYDGIASAGNNECGDYIILTLKVEPSAEKITDIKFLASGCDNALSVGDAVCRLALGRTLSEALAIGHSDVLSAAKNKPPPEAAEEKGSALIQEAVQYYLYMKQAIESGSVENKEEFITRYKSLDDFVSHKHGE